MSAHRTLHPPSGTSSVAVAPVVALNAVLLRITPRKLKLLTQRDVPVEKQGSTYMADNAANSDEAPAQSGPPKRAACI